MPSDPVPAALSEEQALTSAKAIGSPVEVTSLRRADSRVIAQPTGSLVLETYASPRWTKKGGAWRNIDTRLQKNPDGSVAPVATLADVSFSAGGTTPAVRLPVGDGELALSWPGALPAPRLDGDSAVYESVLPGVDLRLRAVADGFTWVLVVASAQAAANPALDEVRLGLATTGPVTRRPRTGGGFEVVDTSGRTVASAGGALMWDSSGLAPAAPAAKGSALSTFAARARQEAVRSAPDLARKAELSTAVQGSDLVIRPDLALLRGKDTTYPVVIDPWTTIGKTLWGYANSTNSTRDDGIPRAGVDPSGDGTFRSYFRFNLSGLSGKTIRSAKFLTEMTHSWACTSTPVNLWRTADLPAAGKQSWSGPGFQLWLEERSGHAHKPSGGAGCADDPQPDMPLEFSSTSLKNDISSFRGDTNYTLSLSTRQSDGSSETTSTWWKKFDAGQTKLSVEYNTNPNTPTAAQLTTHGNYTAPAQACATGTSRPLVRGDFPYLKATLTDPDGSNGGSLSGTFTLQKLVSGVWSTVSGWPRTDSGVAPGAKAEVSLLTKTVSGDVFRWQVQTKDGLGGSSDPSQWCEFYVDYSPPAFTPKVASADGVYLESPPLGTNQTEQGSPGLTAKFTFSANGATDVYDYVYQVNAGPTTVVKAPTLGGAVTVAVTPTKRGQSVLTVRSRDQAGNASAPYDYPFLVAGYSAPTAVWTMNEGTGTTASTTPAGGPQLTLHNFSWSDGWVNGTHKTRGRDRAVGFGFAKGWGDTTVAPPIDSSKSFSVAAWVKVLSKDTFGSVVAASGTNNGAWQLQRDKGGNWYFHTFSADSPTHTRTSVASSQLATIDAWQHVAGVYDAGAKEIRIYVNGVLSGKQPLNSLWKSTGIMEIGRVHYNGTVGNYLEGEIDDVRLWDRVVDPENDLAPLVAPVLVGQWEMDDTDELAPRQVSDESGFGRPLTLTDAPTAAFCANGYNFSTGLCLNGTTGQAKTSGPVLRTGGSWTVSAWVNPAAFGTYDTVLAQCGVWRCAFYLQRQYNAPASWAIVVPDNDMPTGIVYTAAKWGNTPALNTWVHLAASYDDSTSTLRLYVNGTLVSTKTGVPPTWDSIGSLYVGSADIEDYMNGAVDRVRVYQGVLSDKEITTLVSLP
ncbi:LamG domain-containing protein [Micromonospora auratinigra]|uniref:LamG domain-containing protein n=1 Tax=Micromonospora auratinigra TaxID=261654 RepID=UPI0012FD4214|nr:LamG domain-containing protein [Micromonospora auratinigra]